MAESRAARQRKECQAVLDKSLEQQALARALWDEGNALQAQAQDRFKQAADLEAKAVNLLQTQVMRGTFQTVPHVRRPQ